MTQVFKNNAYSSLAAELSASGTLANLATGQGVRFPAPTGGDHFMATLILLDGNGAETAWEIVKCTARATDGLTIERAQEGTTARIWPAGSRIELRTTAGTLDSFTDTAQAAAAAPVQSVFGRTGAVTLQGADVTGALGFTPLDAAQKSAANGIAPLGSDSKVPAAYLPSYVDDVLEYANTAGFPAIGETAKIYVALDTNKTYRWSGSAYVEISASPGTTDALTEGATNLYFTNARAVSALAGQSVSLGSIAITNAGARITGDFSNAAIANRVMFQTSATNGSTSVGLAPNGTGISSNFNAFASVDVANSSYGQLLALNNSEVRFSSNATGTGAQLPMTFYTSGTERMRIDTSGRCIFGTNMQIGSSNAAIQSLQAGSSAFSLGSSTIPSIGGSVAGIDVWGNDGSAYFAGGTINFRATENWSSTNHGTAIQFRVTPNGAGGTLYEAMRINADGNIGIGTSAPGRRLDIENGGIRVIQSYAPTTGAITLRQSSGDAYGAYLQWVNNANSAEKGWLVVDPSSNMIFATGSSERARIDSGGNFLVGVTNPAPSAAPENARIVSLGSSSQAAAHFFTDLSSKNLVYFSRTAFGVTGTISVSGATTSYNTSSDYRLKTNVQPMQNALARVVALKPCTYTWRKDGSAGEGFIAHELQAVVPQCVTGKKDAVDACGNPVYQGVDTSFLVATLVKAIQELKADFDTYKVTHP